jgi:hypothetical protein
MDECQDLLIDERTWRAINDPKTAEYIARRLFVLKEAIESGPEGVREASEVILANIESAYLHTDAHRAALGLYLLSLTGQLKPEDEPLRLINGAIERGRAQVELARKEKRRGGVSRKRVSKAGSAGIPAR